MTRRRKRGEDGLVVAYVVLTSAAMASLLGLALEGGSALNARQAAYVEAEQAARAGAAMLAATGLRAGNLEIEGGAAVAAAESFMASAGHPGRAWVSGDKVVAQVSAFRVPTPLLQIVGIGSLTVSASAAATSVAG
jgi:hypothetical protein